MYTSVNSIFTFIKVGFPGESFYGIVSLMITHNCWIFTFSFVTWSYLHVHCTSGTSDTMNPREPWGLESLARVQAHSLLCNLCCLQHSTDRWYRLGHTALVGAYNQVNKFSWNLLTFLWSIPSFKQIKQKMKTPGWSQDNIINIITNIFFWLLLFFKNNKGYIISSPFIRSNQFSNLFQTFRTFMTVFVICKYH